MSAPLVPGPGDRRTTAIDELDARIVTVFTQDPQIGVLGASRLLGVARGTVQARLDRMARRGVLTGFGPHIDPAALGYPVTAFCTLEIRQGTGREPVVGHLQAIPEVLEAHTITGAGDVMIRIVARDNADLQRVIDRVVDDRHIIRASTVIALATQIAGRTLPLVQSFMGGGAGGGGDGSGASTGTRGVPGTDQPKASATR